MIKKDTTYIEISIGLVAASLPFIVLAYKFGAIKTLAIFLVVIITFLFAKLAIYLFTKQSKLAKGAAIALHGNLIFLFFMPKTLKDKMRELEEKEQKSSNKALNSQPPAAGTPQSDAH